MFDDWIKYRNEIEAQIEKIMNDPELLMDPKVSVNTLHKKLRNRFEIFREDLLIAALIKYLEIDLNEPYESHSSGDPKEH